jgi:hypothetical protein
MGKADNIKRAKKLKDAKRKREQIAMIAAGHGPASQTLQKRISDSGSQIIANTGKIKYSELLTDFIQPILTNSDDIETIKTKLKISVLAWNTSMQMKNDGEVYKFVKQDVLSKMDDPLKSYKMFDKMIARKNQMFIEFTNLITDFEIRKIRGFDYDLTVATTPFIE